MFFEQMKRNIETVQEELQKAGGQIHVAGFWDGLVKAINDAFRFANQVAQAHDKLSEEVGPLRETAVKVRELDKDNRALTREVDELRTLYDPQIKAASLEKKRREMQEAAARAKALEDELASLDESLPENDEEGRRDE